MIERLEDAGFNNAMIAAILAIISKERNFRTQPESCYNNTANSRIRQYHSRTKNLTDAQLNALKKDCVAFFNFVYDGRIGNGVGEGYLYRGRGLHQLTGKSNYQNYSKYAGIDLVKNPDAVIRPEIAAPVAVAYFRNVINSGEAKGIFQSRYGSTSKNPKDLSTAVKIAFNANAGLGNNINSAYWQANDGYKRAQNRVKEIFDYIEEKKKGIPNLMQFSSIALIFIVLGTLWQQLKK